MDENEAPFNLEELEAKAETGDVEAQYEMGWRHALGMEVDLDDDIAVDWLEKAAAAGHMLAKNNMGRNDIFPNSSPISCNSLINYRTPRLGFFRSKCSKLQREIGFVLHGGVLPLRD